MSTHNPQKLYGLDHLRALAIFSVFLFHYFILSGMQPEWLPDFAKFGWTGVDLFFVLSGFLISSQLFEQIGRGERISFGRFFTKRFFRIVPAYLVVVGLYFCVPFFREKEQLPLLWKFLTFTQNFGLDLRNFGTFSHAWSLCVEEHFYLLLPFVLLMLQATKHMRRAYWLLIALFIFGMVARDYSFNHLYLSANDAQGRGMYWYKYLYYPTYNRLDGLLAGVAIAAVRQFLPAAWSRISKRGNWLLLLALAILTGAYFLCDDQQTYYASVFGFPLIALGYGCMVAGAVSESSFLYKWQSKATTTIATLSYAIYLTHKGIIHMTHQLLEGYNINSNIMLAICIATCVIGAALLHVAVEKPFMKLRSMILKSSATRAFSRYTTTSS